MDNKCNDAIYRAFPVSAARAWNALPSFVRALSHHAAVPPRTQENIVSGVIP